MIEWLFVDDSAEDRDSFARALSDNAQVRVTAISGTEARGRLDSDKLSAAGLLMDVDLSNESSGTKSGLGLTADIRAAQHRQVIPSFPIVRFSFREKVDANIGRDSSSDQSFDLKIEKDRISDAGVIEKVQAKLIGLSHVYAAAETSLFELFGIASETWDLWGNSAFEDQLRVADRTYVRARLVIQALTSPGMLVSEELLATRLGVDHTSAGWEELCNALEPISYRGVGAVKFPLWWARGLEFWWAEAGNETPLAGTPISTRHGRLVSAYPSLMPLSMPAGSPGERPWRACELTLEETGGFLPIDPARAVRFKIRPFAPDWLDPTYAALGPALRRGEDPRLDRDDLRRLSAIMRKYR